MRKTYRWLALCISLLSFPAYANDKTNGNITVVYPDGLSPAQATIYDEVISGIRNAIPNVAVITHENEQNNLQSLLDANHPAKVITLGKQSAAAVRQTTYRGKMVCGLHYFKDTCPGVSLTLAADGITQSLHKFLPKANKRATIFRES